LSVDRHIADYHLGEVPVEPKGDLYTVTLREFHREGATDNSTWSVNFSNGTFNNFVFCLDYLLKKRKQANSRVVRVNGRSTYTYFIDLNTHVMWDILDKAEEIVAWSS